MPAILTAYSLHIFWNLTMKEQMTSSIIIVENDDSLLVCSRFNEVVERYSEQFTALVSCEKLSEKLGK